MAKDRKPVKIERGANPNLPRFKTPTSKATLTFAEVLGLYQHEIISKHEVRMLLWDAGAELYLEEVLALVQYRIVKKREAREVLWA